ncbi:MAG TPA: hypothetical protein PLY68_03455 [Myxococcota bacterium]|nr:hypothetical protein [Myxococcota bacterium]HQP95237.1 hypothetical protein [Myxococcota bacterium]
MLELMMTISVIMVMAVLAVPSVMDSMKRQAAMDTAKAIVDAAELSRVQAASTGLAYELRVTIGAGLNNSGTVEVWQGTSSACNYFMAPNPTTGESARLIRTLDVTHDFPSTRIVSTVPANINISPICFKPDGRVFQVLGDLNPVIIPAAAGSDYHAGEALIRVQRMDSTGTLEGPVHVVRIPFNGLASVGLE